MDNILYLNILYIKKDKSQDKITSGLATLPLVMREGKQEPLLPYSFLKFLFGIFNLKYRPRLTIQIQRRNYD